MQYKRTSESGSVLAYVFIICLSVLLLGVSFLQTNGSVTRTMSDLHYQQLADDAAKSGLEYAKYCLLKNNTAATGKTWGTVAGGTDLRPESDCAGGAASGSPTLINDTDLRTRFSVETINTPDRGTGPTKLNSNVQKIVSVGYAELLDGSDITKTYTSTQLHTIPRQTYKTTVVQQGIDFSCSLVSNRTSSTDDRRVRCVGRNDYGQLGNNAPGTDLTSATTPDTLDVLRESGLMENKRVVDLTTGGFHACAIAADSSNNNHVYCWGRNDEGQLGVASAGSTCSGSDCAPKPIEITTLGALNNNRIVSIKASYKNTYALDEQGRLYAWGDNQFSQVGNGTSTDVKTPIMIADDGFRNTSNATISNFYSTYGLDKIATGPRSANVCTLALGLKSAFQKSDDIALCWGQSQQDFGGTTYQTGANGDGTLTTRNRPKQIAAVGGADIRDIVMDGYFKDDGGLAVETHACLLTVDDSVQCWGNNSAKQVNSTATAYFASPQVIAAGGLGSNDHVSSLVAIGQATCALKAGKAYCWGTDINGVHTTPAELTIPGGNPIEGLGITGLTGGSDQVCAQVAYQSYCWGVNGYGQLGDKSTTNRTAPVDTPALYLNYRASGDYRFGKPAAPQLYF